MEKTLARLDTDYIDLLLIHQPAGNYLAGYRLMEQAYEAGKVRAIGLSNFNVDQIEEIMSVCKVRPTVLQTELHPYNQEPKLKKLLKENGIVPQAWYPLGHGDKALLEEPLFAPDHIKANFSLFDFALTGDEMTRIAALNQDKRYYTSTPELLAKYAQMVPPVDEQK